MSTFGGARIRLLASVSVVALLAAIPAEAQQVSMPSGFWMSAGAEYLFATGTSQQTLSSSHALGPQSDRVHDAFGWQLALGGPLPPTLSMPGWDFRVAYTGIRSWSHRKSLSSVSTFPGSPAGTPVASATRFSSDVRQRFDIGDFDIGHDVGLGGVPLRAFIGIRAASFNQATTTQFSNTFAGGEGEHMCSHYFGVGPRVGVDGKYPVGRAGPIAVSLSGQAAGAVLFGPTSLTSTLQSGSTVTQETSSTDNFHPVYNASASLGLAFDFPCFGRESSVTMGYRGEGWWGVLDTQVQNFSLAGSGGTKNGNQYLHGPFLEFAMKL